jgi:anti-sigma B factor antagonist
VCHRGSTKGQGRQSAVFGAQRRGWLSETSGLTPRNAGLEESAMQIDERVVDGVTILDLKGKMTLGEGDELLKDKINSLIQQDKKQLLLNLEGVPYIDSAGLGEIVRTYTTVSRQGGKLKLLNLTKRIQDLLAITKLLTVFETYDVEADAIKSYTS